MRDSPDIASPNFAAVLLAGGRSTRMGFDKATLVIDGQPLWQRQLSTLRALHPRELFISGRRDGPYGNAGVEIIEDEVPDLGPLGGIVSVLRRVESERIVVLAIDLPAMTSHFFSDLLTFGSPTIPRTRDRFEPLAATYPKAALIIAAGLLRDGKFSMQHFAQTLIHTGVASSREIVGDESRLFRNVNRPADLDGI